MTFFLRGYLNCFCFKRNTPRNICLFCYVIIYTNLVVLRLKNVSNLLPFAIEDLHSLGLTKDVDIKIYSGSNLKI